MLALTVANLKIMARNRQTTFWALFFPLILVVVFGLFDFTSPTTSEIVIIDRANNPASHMLVDALAPLEHRGMLQVKKPSLRDWRQLVEDGELDFFLEIPHDFPTHAVDLTAGPVGPERLAGTGSITAVVPVSLTLRDGNEERNQLVIATLTQGAYEANALLSREATPAEENQYLGAQWPHVITYPVGAQEASYFDFVLMDW